MINQESLAINLLQGQRLGIQIIKYYQIIESSNAVELLDMRTYIENMMQAKGKDKIYLCVLEQMKEMIDSKLK